jgi:hypothetical protein
VKEEETISRVEYFKQKFHHFSVKVEDFMYIYFPPSQDLPKNQRDFIQKKAKERKEFLKNQK